MSVSVTSRRPTPSARGHTILMSAVLAGLIAAAGGALVLHALQDWLTSVPIVDLRL